MVHHLYTEKPVREAGDLGAIHEDCQGISWVGNTSMQAGLADGEQMVCYKFGRLHAHGGDGNTAERRALQSGRGTYLAECKGRGRRKLARLV